ncbi:MAG: glycosyltransferase family 39 protein, partial [Thermoleophilia bacterium]|nr:glycosyltransferase family 39 protein [Thermoleophilia bacterium]
MRAWGRRNSGLVLLVLVAVGITLPFIFKAFHMDDTVFVWLGQEKLNEPFALGLADHGYEGNFFSLYMDTHPPLLTSYLSLLIWIFGGPSEAGMHIGFLIFPLLAAVSMFYLGRRFTDSPLFAALLLIVTPGFMVMAQSVMTDVPALSLCLAAIAAFVYAIDRGDRQNRLLVAAGICTSLAILTTYQSLSLLPLLFVYALLRRQVTIRNMTPLAAGLAVFAAIVFYYLVATGNLPKLSYSFGVSLTPSFIANKILSIVSVMGGAIIFSVMLAIGMLKGKKEYLAFIALFGLILIFFLNKSSSGEYTLASGILEAVFYSAGLLALYRFFNAGADTVFADDRSDKDRDDIFLVLWIAGVLFYSILLLPYASTRYLLPLFPPAVLMFVRYARGIIRDKKWWKRFAITTVAFTAAAGLAVSTADYQLAGVYRDFAAAEGKQLREDGRQLWFAGEFGLRYYLEAEGGRYLTKTDNSPEAGDRVVLSHGLIAYFISDELKNRLQLERSVDYPSAWPVRVEDPLSQA